MSTSATHVDLRRPCLPSPPTSAPIGISPSPPRAPLSAAAIILPPATVAAPLSVSALCPHWHLFTHSPAPFPFPSIPTGALPSVPSSAPSPFPPLSCPRPHTLWPAATPLSASVTISPPVPATRCLPPPSLPHSFPPLLTLSSLMVISLPVSPITVILSTPTDRHLLPPPPCSLPRSPAPVPPPAARPLL